jgi:hypothetical protein
MSVKLLNRKNRGDNIPLSFGNAADSKIYFDGTNTYWEPQAVGTGKLMIALGDSPPAPDADFHIWNGSAGSVNAISSASLVIEDSANAVINLLAPLNGEAGLWIGNSDSAVRGRLIYYGRSATLADSWEFQMVGSARLKYSVGAFAFQEETTISTTAGDLILDPAVNVKIGGTADHGTTVGTNVLSIFNGTAPVGTLANGISLYSTSGELYVKDAADNSTQLSPHDSAGNWVFNSTDAKGKRLVIHMEKFMRALEAHFGWGFIEEFIEEA